MALATGIVHAIGMVIMASASNPPSTPAEPVKDVVHGIEIVDDYRWLEGSDAPEIEGEDAALDQRVDRWTDAQNAYTRSLLSSVPGRAAVEARLEELLGTEQVDNPETGGDRSFFLRRLAGQKQWTVVWRKDGEEEPRLLLDPNELDPEGLTALGSFTPSHDGHLAAFTLFKAGDELTTLYLVNVDTGVWLADEIPGRVTGVSWLPDGTGFLYNRLADVKNPYSAQVQFHRVGTHHRQDPILSKQATEGPLATTWGPFGTLSRDARWLLLGYWTSTDSNDLWVVDFDRWRRTGELVKVPIAVGEEATALGEVVGDTLFMTTTLGAPNKRLVAVDLNDPSRERWREVIPESPTAVLQGVSVARGYLVARYLENAASRLRVVRYDGTDLGDLELPGLGSADVTANQSRRDVFVSFESYDRPRTIYRVDLPSGAREEWARPSVPLEEGALEVRQAWYPSKDGTKVSLFLVHKKGLELDGENPTLLGGYGGFGIPVTPQFSAQMIPWLEAGGVLAMANLRGGGEYGRQWHEAGKLEKKQTVFDDFIAAAEFLVREGYTRPEKLGIRGGSNGGLLTGAALVQRPDLFGAVVSAVPLLDMIRYQHFLMARFWVPEYGSAENPEQLPFLLDYSPYHNVKDDVAYPAVFLTAGENDRRVHPLHARKMAARLQAATAGDPKEDPILLWVDRSAGHGSGKPLDLQVESAADVLMFLMWQLEATPAAAQISNDLTEAPNPAEGPRFASAAAAAVP